MNIERKNGATGSCWICRVRERIACAEFGMPDLGAVTSCRAVRTVRAGADLFGQGEVGAEVYVLQAGWVFTYLILEDGRRQILSFGLRGGLFGLLPEGVRTLPFGCQALSDAAICAAPRGQVLRLMQERPEIGLQLMLLGKRDELLLYEHLTSIGRRSARERVAYLLLELFCRAQRRLPAGRGDAFALPLNQAHIADAMGLTSIHVSRTLKGLREDGILQLRDGTLEIFDPERLLEAAVVDTDNIGHWIGAAEEPPPLPTAEEAWIEARLGTGLPARAALRANGFGLRAAAANGPAPRFARR